MTDISIQFHALPEEISGFVTRFVNEHSLHEHTIGYPQMSCPGTELLRCRIRGLVPMPLELLYFSSGLTSFEIWPASTRAIDRGICGPALWSC